LDINIPEENASTIAGYLIYKTESFPEVSQTFKFDDIIYEVLNKNKNQITQIKITLENRTNH
jgi:Mg2+/Co2+ transporter CorB